MGKKPLNEGTTRGNVKGGVSKSQPTTNTRPSQPPPPPKKKYRKEIKRLKAAKEGIAKNAFADIVYWKDLAQAAERRERELVEHCERLIAYIDLCSPHPSEAADLAREYLAKRRTESAEGEKW